jgi:phosphoribosylamine--glycine ligase
MQKIEDEIVIPTVEGLRKDNLPYKGFIFIGLIKVDNAPFVIEYNVRMGDPETEAVLPRIKSDLLELLVAVSENRLHEKNLDIDPKFASTVMMVSGGYPEDYKKGYNITGIPSETETLIFHAGTKKEGENLQTSGGRVMAITSMDRSMKKALKKSYIHAKEISFKDKYFRKDIGFDL